MQHCSMLISIAEHMATRPTSVLKPSVSEDAASKDDLNQASSRHDDVAGLLHQVRGYECKRTLRRAGVRLAEGVGAVWDHKRGPTGAFQRSLFSGMESHGQFAGLCRTSATKLHKRPGRCAHPVYLKHLWMCRVGQTDMLAACHDAVRQKDAS